MALVNFAPANVAAAKDSAGIMDQEMQTLERAMNVREGQARIPEIQASAELKQAQAQKARVDAQREQQLLQIMAQGPQQDEDGKTQGNLIFGKAVQLLNAGFINEAMKMLNQGSEIATREKDAETKAFRARTQLVDQKDKEILDAENFISGAVDEQSFNILKNTWISSHPNTPLPPTLQTYNPAVIAAMKNATKMGLDRRRAEASEARTAADQAYKDARLRQEADQHAVMNGFRAWQKNFEEMKWRDRKVAGPKAPKTAGGASNNDIEAAQAMILRDHPGIDASMPLGSKSMVSPAAYDMANEAKVLTTRNPNLSMPQAMAMVYDNMTKQNMFRTVEKVKKGMIWDSKEEVLGYVPGKPAATPAANPQASGGKGPSGADLFIPGKTIPQKGKPYDLGDGVKWVWDGSHMKRAK